jgi:hypothetical protein
MECKNCGNTANQSYCPFCAQKTSVDRITFKTILEELSDTLFQINRGFLYTIKELFIRPGKAISNYIEGKRKNYFKPIAYVFTISTIYFILVQFLDSTTFFLEAFEGFSRSSVDRNDEFEATKSLIEIFKWLINNYSYTTLILLPIYSIASYLAFFGAKLNYLEHVVLNSYLSGQQAIIYILFLIPNFYFKDISLLEDLPIILSTIYAFWIFKQFFYELGIVSTILRTVLTYILYFVLIFGIVTGFGILLGLIEFIRTGTM